MTDTTPPPHTPNITPDITSHVRHVDQRAASPWPAPRPATTPPPSRAVRLAWLIPGTILAIAALGWGTYNVLSVLAHEEHTVRAEFPAADVTSVDVTSATGSVVVEGGADDTISIVGEVSDGWRPTDVDIDLVDGVLRVRSACPILGQPWCRTDFRLSVPAELPVRVDADNGSVTARALRGMIDLDSDNGRVEVSDVSGTIRLSTDNGSVIGRRIGAGSIDASTSNGRIELSFIEPPDDVRGRTDNGRIEVVVPDGDVAYRVTLQSDNGSTETLVRTDPASTRTIDLATDNGSVTVRPPG